MPTYLYECEECGKFEEFQKISDDPLEKCPECGSDVKKLIGNPGVIFKGSGFYSTDSKNNATEKSSSGDEKVS
ncbi:MAG: FmdB family zinc ribbon protein [Bacillota bacterium]